MVIASLASCICLEGVNYVEQPLPRCRASLSELGEGLDGMEACRLSSCSGVTASAGSERRRLAMGLRRGLAQAVGQGEGGCFDAVVGADLGEDVGHVPVHRVHADTELAGDLPVVLAAGDEAQ